MSLNPRSENPDLHPTDEDLSVGTPDLGASGKLNLEPVITHRLKLAEFPKAMEYLRTGEAIKVVFKLE